jgi:Flp pilus assembly protein TadG
MNMLMKIALKGIVVAKALKRLTSDKENAGTSLIEAALLIPLLLLMLAGAVDLGKACYMAIEVSSAAQSGAEYGVQNPSDTDGMVAASRLDAVDVPTLSAVASYGCECSDGTSDVATCGTTPTCNFNIVDYVEVDTTATYSSLLTYPGVPGSIVISGKARMRAAH